MKYCVGQLVREGGIYGPVSRIVGYEDGKYHVESNNGHAHGWIEEEFLFPFKDYEQLCLF